MLLPKKRFIWVLAAMFFLLIAGCIFKIVQPNAVLQLQGQHSFHQGTITEREIVYDHIALKPGVYYVELEYDTDTDLGALCNMQDGTVYTGGLLTNGEHFYSGLNKTGFHMWLFEGTENMQVTVSYAGKGMLETGNLTITETNQLWTMLLVILVFMAGVIVLWQKYPVKEQKRQTFFFVLLIGFFASVPCLYGSMLGGADLTYHLQRIEGVKDGLLSGQFPVRLEPEWVYGHGYADAIFYCNSLLYFPALFRLAGFTVTASYNAYCVMLNFVTAWIAWYCFSRIFKDNNIGLVCSALYTLSIFRLYKLYVTGAVGEGSAYTFLPLALYGLYRIFTEDINKKEYKTCWIPVMAGYAGLIQTHVLTCEITAFLTIAVCLVCIVKVFRKEPFLELAKGALGALGLSLWYLVPFLDYYLTQDVHIKHVSARTIQDRGLYVSQLLTHFWEASGKEVNGMEMSPIGIGPVLVFGLCVFWVLWVHAMLRGRKNDLRQGVIFAVLGAFLMLLSLQYFPWNRIQSVGGAVASLVSSLQFPNRFLGWGTACLVATFGFCLWYLRDVKRLYYLLGIAIAVVGVGTSYLYMANSVMKNENCLQLYNEESMGFGYISGAEYLIQGTDEKQLTFAGPVTGENVVINAYSKDYLKVEMNCTNSGAEESYVELPLLFYKGYRAFDTDTGMKYTVCAGDNYVVRVLIPQGYAGNLTVEFKSPIYWRLSEAVSAVIFVSLISTWWIKRRKKAAWCDVG